YARQFGDGLRRLAGVHTGVAFAVENMYPIRMAGREFVPYAPDWDPTRAGHDAYTLDLSHCSAARVDALRLAARMGDGLVHVHLGDGSGEGRDEHLVPGQGNQPCARLLAQVSAMPRVPTVAVEVSTRRAPSREVREEMLAEALSFARTHFRAQSAVQS